MRVTYTGAAKFLLQRKIRPMVRKTFACLLLSMASLVTLALGQNQPAILTIQLDKPISKVSPMLYGLMTEEINFSYDGGLYAEMVRNRTFRARRRDIPYWYLVEQGNAAAKMEVDAQTGPSQALNNSLKLEVTQADAQSQAGILNGGYWGMPSKSNTTYKGSFYAKADSDTIGAVNVKLMSDAEDKKIAATTIATTETVST